MSKIYAVVEDGIVTNIVLWDGKGKWADSGRAILTDSDTGIGWQYENGVFTAPAIEKTADEIARENMSTANSEYAGASIKITSFNDRIADEDWSGTTESVIRENLLAWTAYRKALRAYISAADWSKRLPESPE